MDRARDWRWALPPVAAIVFAVLAFLQVPAVNGPPYWKWHWRRHANPIGVAAAFGFAALPALLAQVVRERAPEQRLVVGLLILSSVALPVTGAALHEGRSSSAWIRAAILDPSVTGFLVSAQEIVEFEHRRPDVDWVRNYDKIMPYFPLHSRTKPFGLVVAHYLSLRAFGPTATIAIAAAASLLCGAATVVVIFTALRAIGFGQATAIDAATLFVLAPSMTLFFPLPDIAYPLLTITAIAFWWRALSRRDAFAAAVASLVIFLASILSFPLLAIGIPLLLMTISQVAETRSPKSVFMPLVVAAGTFFVAYLLLFITTHYPAMASFRSALAGQRWLLVRLGRSYPRTIPYDLLDFCLGLGWAIPVLAVMWLARFRSTPRNLRPLATAGVVTPLLIALSGQLQAETARVWIFLMPLTVIPAAIELSQWPLRARLASCASLVIVTIALSSTMEFIFV